MNELLKSSDDPQKLSLTIRGYLMLGLPLIIGALQLVDVPIAEADVVVAIQAISFIVGGAVSVWGQIRKVYNMFRKSEE